MRVPVHVTGRDALISKGLGRTSARLDTRDPRVSFIRQEAERRALMEAHSKRCQEIESKHESELSSMRVSTVREKGSRHSSSTLQCHVNCIPILAPHVHNLMVDGDNTEKTASIHTSDC